MDAKSPPPTEEIKAEPTQYGVGAAVRLLAKVTLLIAAVAASVFAIALLPEGNDYGQVTQKKHERLASIGSPKIVLVGGSNWAYGVDSRMIEQATGCPVANMGVNGYFGVRFLLNEVKPQLARGDIAVVAYEYDNYFKSVEGAPASLFVVAKLNPELVNALSPAQRVDVALASAFIAQSKMLRYMRDGIEGARVAILGERPDEGGVGIRDIERLSGFTPEGDLVSHLGVEWPYDLEDGIAPPGRPVEVKALDLTRDFAAEMERRGVRVMMSYSPVLRRFYEEHQTDIDSLEGMVAVRAPLVAPSPPSAYVFDRHHMFDTVYHLNAEGRAIRTQRLIEDLQRQFGPGALCAAQSQ